MEKEEKKEEKKEKKEDEKKEKKEDKEGDGVITALYKLNLHCPQCSRLIKKPLMRTQGVHSVDYNIEKGEIKVTGKIDGKKIHKQIEKISKKKVEMTLVPKSKDKGEEKKDKKQLVSSTTTLKVFMHCGRCESDLKKAILKLQGVHGVKSDSKAQTLAVEGTIEPPKLVKYIHKKVGKHAEIVVKKPEKKTEEKKETVKEVEVKTVEKPEKKTEEKKETVKEVEVKTVDIKAISYEGEVKKIEVKNKDSSNPYFIHYVYAPQMFSDENPNACTIM